MALSTNLGTSEVGCTRTGPPIALFPHPDTWENRPVLVLYHALNREVGRAAEDIAVEICLLTHLVVVVHPERLSQCHEMTLNR